MRRLHPHAIFVVATLLAMLASGCVSQARYDKVYLQMLSAHDEAEKFKKAKTKLYESIAQKDKQIATLQTLGQKRLEKLNRVERINLSGSSTGVDLDDKPGDEAIKVYLQPIDQDGSTIKAAGSIKIELYDLAAAPKENLIGRYEWSVDEISKHWASFVVHHYSFVCKWQAQTPKHDEITIRVEFTDYLTGKTFTNQTVCKIQLPPKGSDNQAP